MENKNLLVTVFHENFFVDLGYDLFTYDVKMLPQASESLDL